MLQRLKELQKPIRVSIIGMGAMGQGLLYQCRVTPGTACVAVADIQLEKAIACAERFAVPHRIVESPGALQDAVRDGVLAVCEDGLWLAAMDGIDVLIESSNAIAAGGRFALAALERGRHLMLMNAEVDLIFGPELMRRAHGAGVVYSSCDGDQHTVIKRLLDELVLWGFEPVMGGNIKGFLDRTANPATIVPEAEKRHLDYRACVGYTDGTKLNIEMALLANALGMRTAVPGMHGPRAAHVRDVFRLFDFAALWNGGEPLVDYVLGAEPDGGVFAVGYCEHPYQQELMRYYKMGDGPFYLFYRPYHLCHVEAMACVAAAVLDGRSLLEPRAGLRTNVFARAKTDLRRGTALDGIGGYTCYGEIENCPAGSEAPDGLPVCLAEDVRLLRDVAANEPIRLADVDADPARFDYDLYAKARARPGLGVDIDHRRPPRRRASETV